jgi:ribosomal protein L32
MTGKEKRSSSARRDGRRHIPRFNKNKQHDFPICPVCGKSVRDILTAIALDSTKEPAHFDCIVRKIAEHEELQQREKIVYLGKGSFGIIQYNKGKSGFVVRKRIQYEEIDKGPDWRKKICEELKNR